MLIDTITLKDLSIIEGNHSLFTIINQCTTIAGSEILLYRIKHPLQSIQQIESRQTHVAFWIKHADKWPNQITNGALVMIKKFLESPLYGSTPPNDINIRVTTIINRLINKDSNTYPQFAMEQIHGFLSGCKSIMTLFEAEGLPEEATIFYENMQKIFEQVFINKLLSVQLDKLSIAQLKKYCYEIKRYHKNDLQTLLQDYAQLDATLAMAKTTKLQNWCMPHIVEDDNPVLKIKKLYHPLISNAIANDINLDNQQPFLFLTGANMAGKSTFLRATGIAVLLAHIGMGIPAQAGEISLFKGLISNMKVEDNIILGESYFFAEVKRMKLTAEKINQQAPNLILMDEIFKGTNIHDAYDCSLAVIEGLLHNNNNIQILSTHLYELYKPLQHRLAVQFKYFETLLHADHKFTFTYTLKDGVSNDRIGFAVLQQEGVIDLLRPNN